MSTFEDLVWTRPWAFSLLALLALARWRRGPRPAVLLAGPVEAMGRGGSRERLAALSGACLWAAVCAFVLALAGPAERVLWERVRTGMDLLLAIDQSSSMAEPTGDSGITRFEVAREGALVFADAREGDRVGAIAFARHPTLVLPLSTDREALREALSALEPVAADSPDDVTAMGLAVGEGARVLARARPAGAREGVVVLITDGEETAWYPGARTELSPEDAAELAVAFGVRVHGIVLGAGDGEPIPAALLALSERSGGLTWRAETGADLTRVLERLDDLEREPLGEPDARLDPRHRPFLLLGLALWALGFLARLLGLGVAP